MFWPSLVVMGGRQTSRYYTYLYVYIYAYIVVRSDFLPRQQKRKKRGEKDNQRRNTSNTPLYRKKKAKKKKTKKKQDLIQIFPVDMHRSVCIAVPQQTPGPAFPFTSPTPWPSFFSLPSLSGKKKKISFQVYSTVVRSNYLSFLCCFGKRERKKEKLGIGKPPWYRHSSPPSRCRN